MILDKAYKEKDESYYSKVRPEMLQYIPNNVKFVLDVGCSKGNFGKTVKKEFNCQVWGVEPDEHSAEIAKEQLDKVFNTIFNDEINFNSHKFDCIIFNDVLEHLLDPLQALIDCKKHLNPGGVIVCSIPNFRYFDAIIHILKERDFRYCEEGIFDKTHLRFFTKRSIKRLFLEAGYKINMLNGINSLTFCNSKNKKIFKILNFFLFKKIEDMEFLQFAIQVSLS